METFSFNNDAFNFWPIYDAVKKYYPIGIPFEEDNYEFYRSYPGIVELTRLVIENVHNDTNYQNTWVNFEKYLEGFFQKDVEGTTYGQAPSFSGFVSLEKKKTKEIYSYKELHFAVSLVGPYYTIYGLDSTSIKLNMEDVYPNKPDRSVHYNSINAITTSPYQEYKTDFINLEKKIKEKFEGYKMIPYEINCQIVHGLSVNYSDKKQCTIFNALFHDTHNLPELRYRGDGYYGSRDWRIQHHN